MPRWEPPRDGFVVNANNLPAHVPGEPPWPRHDWAHDRAWRIDERLAAAGRIDLGVLGATQNDVTSKAAIRFVPRLLALAEPSRTSMPGVARAALDTLRTWHYEARRALVAPTLWRAWYGALQRRSALDGLQGLTLAALDGREPGALRSPDGAPETAAQAVTAALDTALTRLTATLGPDLASWTWERAHRARFKHRLRDRGSFEPPTVGMDGDNSTPSVGRSDLPWSTDVTHGPVFRHLVDLAIPDSSLAIVTPGNSGAGPHSADLAERWARHEYVPLLLDWDRIARYREAEIILPPRR
jgi:penicillin amidase